MPTSAAFVAQAAQSATIPSWVASAARSRPSASARRIGTDMLVSSVHSPGAQRNVPPPFISTIIASSSGGPNS